LEVVPHTIPKKTLWRKRRDVASGVLHTIVEVYAEAEDKNIWKFPNLGVLVGNGGMARGTPPFNAHWVKEPAQSIRKGNLSGSGRKMHNTIFFGISCATVASFAKQSLFDGSLEC
jgi:hypothetical protein